MWIIPAVSINPEDDDDDDDVSIQEPAMPQENEKSPCKYLYWHFAYVSICAIKCWLMKIDFILLQHWVWIWRPRSVDSTHLVMQRTPISLPISLHLLLSALLPTLCSTIRIRYRLWDIFYLCNLGAYHVIQKRYDPTWFT
jgi:hypothetical protein